MGIVSKPWGVVIPLIVGVLLGVAIGWGLGAWSTCGTGCRFDINLFGAIGTWLGGVGAIAVAAVGGLYARNRRQFEEEQRAAAKVDSARRAAIFCPLRVDLIGNDIGGYQKAEIRLQNGSGADMEWPVITLDETSGKSIRLLKPGGKWTMSLTLEGIVSTQDRKDRGKTKRVVLDKLEERLYADFTVGGLRFRRTFTDLVSLGPSNVSLPPEDLDAVGPKMDPSGSEI